MKLFKKLTFTIVILAATSSFSQTLESLKEDTKKMYEQSYNMAFEDVLNYTHPKVFEIVDRQQMLDALYYTFENDIMKVRLVTIDPKFTYSEIKQIDDKLICIVNYNNAMRMTFEEKLTDGKADLMYKTFKSSDEYYTVKFEKERNSFYLEGNATMIAVAENATNNEWKFINYRKADNILATKLLGESTLNQLGL